MNYGIEAWYKLFVRESTDDRLLPVFNRALRDFLLRLAKSREDATILRNTSNPGEDLARALGAHPSEAATVAEYVRSMLADGYLSHDGARLWITNFVAAQTAKSKGAVRQGRWRKTKASRETGSTLTHNVTRDTNGGVTRDTPGDARETLQKRIEEKIRVEKNREDPDRGGVCTHEASEQTADPEPEPADPGRETICPADLVAKLEANGMAAALAEKLAAPIESVRDELRRFEAYWTIGKGMGQKRTGWPGKARQWVVEQHGKPGGLKAPGAVAHDRRDGEYVPSAATAALMGGLLRRNL